MSSESTVTRCLRDNMILLLESACSWVVTPRVDYSFFFILFSFSLLEFQVGQLTYLYVEIGFILKDLNYS